MTAHIHAELMLQYAQDALKTNEPWKLWEAYWSYSADGTDDIDGTSGKWVGFTNNPIWDENVKYRRKPEMITVGKVSFPKPIDYELKEGERYYIPAIICVVETYMYNYHRWSNSIEDFNRSSNGLIHLLKDNAVAHTKALIKISKGEF